MDLSLIIDARKIELSLEEILDSTNPQTEIIEIYHYRNKEFNYSLNHFKKLNFFRLHGKLESFPTQVLQLSELTRLDLSKNNIHELPAMEFDINCKLKFLNLSRNNIQTIPDCFLLLLSSIEELVLNTNSLSDLPRWMADVRSLKRISLDSNKFSKVPECLYSLENLNYLSFDHNPLSEIEQKKLLKLCPLQNA